MSRARRSAIDAWKMARHKFLLSSAAPSLQHFLDTRATRLLGCAMNSCPYLLVADASIGSLKDLKGRAVLTVVALFFGAYFLRRYLILIAVAAVIAYLFTPLYNRLRARMMSGCRRPSPCWPRSPSWASRSAG